MFRFIAFASFLATISAFQPSLDGRIVGGEDADITNFPYQLSLQMFDSHICGASIISSKWAVTAAHCTEGSSASLFSIVAGISNLRESGQRVQIAKIHQHPGFNITHHLIQDVSVLELASEITINAKAQPIALASDGSDPAGGTDVVVTGWGSTKSGGSIAEQLQQVSVKIVNRDVCNGPYYGQITKYSICAGVATGGKDSCQGDSGGPLVANGKLIGIVSWGLGCAIPGIPGVYSNVGALRSFIKEQSGI